MSKVKKYKIIIFIFIIIVSIFGILKFNSRHKIYNIINSSENVEELVFQDGDNLQQNTSTKHNPTNLNENKEVNEDVKLNNIDPIEIVSNIIPYGNFEIDREEVKDGIEYIVIRCIDPESNATIGWYYLQKDDGKLFELNLSNNILDEVIQKNLNYNSDNYKKLLGHWIAENDVEYWYGDGYVYSKDRYSLSKYEISAYISEKEEIKNYFKAYNEAVVAYSANDIQNLTEALCKDDIIDNCIILQYEPKDDYIYHQILIFKDDNTVQSFGRFNYDMFGYNGDHIRVDYKVSPN